MKIISVCSLGDDDDEPVYRFLATTHQKAYRIIIPFAGTAEDRDPDIWHCDYFYGFYLLERLRQISVRTIAVVPNPYADQYGMIVNVYVSFPVQLSQVLWEAGGYYGSGSMEALDSFTKNAENFWDLIEEDKGFEPACKPYLYFMERLQEDSDNMLYSEDDD